jgi:hypothetical protein
LNNAPVDTIGNPNPLDNVGSIDVVFPIPDAGLFSKAGEVV